MNNGKYTDKDYLRKQAEWRDKRWGVEKEHTKKCIHCGKEFTFIARRYTKHYETRTSCSLNCSNSRQKHWDNVHAGRVTRESYQGKTYRIKCFKVWGKVCHIKNCGFDKIVVVHHIDEDHHNNDIDNLLPLCPNHHEMMHSMYRDEMVALIEEAVKLRGYVNTQTQKGDRI
tara:strand:- start:674 stop:1186 length:513 start_codon:yes stop_codon:yes gene_type:complete